MEFRLPSFECGASEALLLASRFILYVSDIVVSASISMIFIILTIFLLWQCIAGIASNDMSRLRLRVVKESKYAAD